MYLARITARTQSVSRIDDHVETFLWNREKRLPREPRAWRFGRGGGGGAAISQTPEGALASARAKLEEEL